MSTICSGEVAEKRARDARGAPFSGPLFSLRAGYDCQVWTKVNARVNEGAAIGAALKVARADATVRE
eukprot:10194321-Lingulodinium_polyedra.AAC.1